MAVAWTPHRFTGGLLALDTTNTVVLRGDAEKSFDRFTDPA
jgi:predicted RNA-binding Zn ribbon-like protein